jgi:hypothetical protein
MARSIASSQPDCPGVKMAWLSIRREPASLFTRARASAFISLVRNQSWTMSDGAPEMSATLVSLSRKISL